MTEKTLEKLATKFCEACGEEFSCGAEMEKCWCFEIDLSAETLAKLPEKYKNCLCRKCLRQFASPANSQNND